jgi:hypothetical protein
MDFNEILRYLCFMNFSDSRIYNFHFIIYEKAF